MPSTAAALAEAVAIARPIVERVVWCAVATTSPGGEPRSRLMHPVWWWDGPVPTAYVTARTTPVKVRHLAANPRLSCHYWDPAHDTVAIDATAEWLDLDGRRAAWAAIAAVAPPYGFDPGIVWPDGPTAADCGILRLTAHRVVATPAGRPGLRWSA
jgi:hypothetical protein